MSTPDQKAPPPPPATGPPWVTVAGPPGSGGDVVAQALACFGLPLVEPGRSSTTPSQSDDPSLPLTVVNDELLDLLEGAWWAPPERPPGWEHWPELDSAAPPLLASLDAALADACRAGSDRLPKDAPALWYDSRHALVLPFWRAQHGGVRAVVITWRRPGATVDELGSLRIDDLHALALWESNLVDGLVAAAGLPVLGVDVDAAFDDPVAWARVAADFVAHLGVEVLPDAGERAASIVRSSAESAVSAHRPGDEEEAASTARMASRLASVAGFHRQWEAPQSNSVGRWPTALLKARLASHRSARGSTDAWALADDSVRETHSAVRALDWTVDRLAEAMVVAEGGPSAMRS